MVLYPRRKGEFLSLPPDPASIVTQMLKDGSVTEAKLSFSPTGWTEGARVYNSANQSTANATETTATFDSEDYDTDAIHDTVTNNSRLTCKTAGKYLIGAQVTFQASGVGFRVARFLLNGATNIARVHVEPVTETYVGFTMLTVYDLSVNDYVELVVKQTSGGALWLEGGGVYTHFWMHKIG